MEQTKMTKNFTVAVVREDDWYIARCLENGVTSQGKSVEAALQNVEEAISLFYEDEPPMDVPLVYMANLEVVV